jgi:hypothetical protein
MEDHGQLATQSDDPYVHGNHCLCAVEKFPFQKRRVSDVNIEADFPIWFRRLKNYMALQIWSV